MSTSIVHNADCLEAMRQMPDKAFELAGMEREREYVEIAEARVRAVQESLFEKPNT